MADLSRTLSRGRIHAERLMTDTCTIEVESGETFDAGTLTRTPTYSTLYQGKCRVRPRDTQDRIIDSAGADSGVADVTLSIPVSDVVIPPRARVTITASGQDASQVGRVLTTLGAIHGSQITARRIACQEVS